jgi:hypothetical protein
MLLPDATVASSLRFSSDVSRSASARSTRLSSALSLPCDRLPGNALLTPTRRMTRACEFTLVCLRCGTNGRLAALWPEIVGTAGVDRSGVTSGASEDSGIAICGGDCCAGTNVSFRCAQLGMEIKVAASALTNRPFMTFDHRLIIYSDRRFKARSDPWAALPLSGPVSASMDAKQEKSN